MMHDRPSDHERYIQQIGRYVRERELELNGQLQRVYAKPKEALVIGTQLQEIKELCRVMHEIKLEVYK